MARDLPPVDWFGVNHYSPLYAAADAGRAARLQPWRRTGGAAAHADRLADPAVGLSRRPARVSAPLRACRSTSPRTASAPTSSRDATGAIADHARVGYLRDYVARHAHGDRRGRRRARLFRLVAARQFRMGLGLRHPVRARLHRLSDLKRTPKASFRWYADLIKAARAGSAGETDLPGGVAHAIIKTWKPGTRLLRSVALQNNSECLSCRPRTGQTVCGKLGMLEPLRPSRRQS